MRIKREIINMGGRGEKTEDRVKRDWFEILWTMKLVLVVGELKLQAG